MRKIIAVAGSAAGDELKEKYLKMAEKVGYLVAERGGVLVCGGLGGIMEAAARGAKKAGGLTVGILPWKKEAANSYIDIPLATNMGFYRNSIIANCSDALISVCGRWGTLNEVAMAVSLGKTTIVIDESGGVSNLIARESFLMASGRRPIVAASPEEAVKIAFESGSRENEGNLFSALPDEK